LSPSEPVDAAWHAFLRGREYSTYCQREFGRVIGHYHDIDEKTRKEGYRRARSRMKEQFGQLDKEIWPTQPAAFCGVTQSEE
jgi:hypothetical protein